MRYVSSIQGGKIRTNSWWRSTLTYANNEELIALVKELIRKGYAFVDEPAGWSPAAVLQDLRDKGLFDEAFTAITWSGPNVYRTYKINGS